MYFGPLTVIWYVRTGIQIQGRNEQQAAPDNRQVPKTRSFTGHTRETGVVDGRSGGPACGRANGRSGSLVARDARNRTSANFRAASARAYRLSQRPAG